MGIKLKALGLGSLAAMAMGTFSVTTASAATGGHFLFSQAHATVVWKEVGLDATEVLVHGLEGGIVCDEGPPHYTFFIGGGTVNDLRFPPRNLACHTTGNGTNISVAANECTYRFTIAAGTTDETEQTMDVACPAGKAIVITHPNCTITVPPQSGLSGQTYTKIVDGGQNAITVDSNVQFSTQFHGGICVFLGTAHTGTLKGSSVITAFDTELNRLGIVVT